MTITEYHDCTLNLDDVEQYNQLNRVTGHHSDSNATTFTGVIASIIPLSNGPFITQWKDYWHESYNLRSLRI